MMPQLSEDLVRFIRNAVRSGRYPDEGAVITDALVRLRNLTDTNVDASDESGGSTGSGKKLTKQEFQRHRCNRPLDPPEATDANAGNSVDLIDEEGEIVDEVVIRERLIEWLDWLSVRE